MLLKLGNLVNEVLREFKSEIFSVRRFAILFLFHMLIRPFQSNRGIFILRVNYVNFSAT